MAFFEHEVGHEIGAHQFLGAVLGIGSALLGGLTGMKGSKMADPGVYAMSSKQRKGLAGSAYNQLQGIYGAAPPPSRYWGEGAMDWGSRNQLGIPQGTSMWDAVMGGNGFGGGGGGGGASGAGAKGYAAKAEYVDMGDEAMNMLPSERIKQATLGGIREGLEGQTREALQDYEQQSALTGMDSSSPASQFLRQRVLDEQRKQLAGGYRNFFTDFTREAGGRRAQGLINNSQVGTQASIATAGNMTNASMASAQNATSASIANAGMSEAEAQRRAAGSQFMLGLWDRNQDRDLDRYQGLNAMNMGWQQPVNQKQQQQTGFGKFMGGMSSGLGLFQGMGGSQGIMGLFKGGGGGGYTYPADMMGPPQRYG